MVVGVLAVLVYGAILLLLRPRSIGRPVLPAGRWAVGHYDADGATHVVLQKVVPGGDVVDEHVIATIPVDAPDYDAAFLSAMAAARERRALFDVEEDE